jgi:hypothetical protein
MDRGPIDLSSVIRLVPNHQLDHYEALVIAEVQAMKLLRLGGILIPPVPVVQLVQRAGIRVEPDPLVDELGSTFVRGGVWHIRHGIADQSDLQATVAHQLKLILDRPFGEALYPHQDVMGPQLRRHHVAEYFATCLTLPREWIEQLWRQGERDPAILADLFGTTSTAMRFRLQALRLIGSDPKLLPQ